MNISLVIAGRNIRIFFRDRTQVFFSLLSVFIIIGLYVLFLGDMMLKNAPEGAPDARFLMDCWIMAGLITVTAVTTVMGAFGILVEDKTQKIMKDFKSAPIGRAQIVGGYFLGTVFIGMVMCMVALALVQVYVLTRGGSLLPAGVLLNVLWVTVLTVLCSAAMVFCLVSVFDSSSAFGTASTIIGTMVGFMTGIYVPIGSMPGPVQTAIKLFPPSHSAALLRQFMMEEPMQEVFAHAPPSITAAFRENLGVDFLLFGRPVSETASALYLVATTVLFFGMAVLITRRRKS